MSLTQQLKRPKVALYSYSYAGMSYDGPALSIKEVISRAKGFGFEGIELDCRTPHAIPYLLKEKDRKEIVDYLAKESIELSALAANNDFSSPVIEHRDANIQMVIDMIRLCRDLGAPVLCVFMAWQGTSRRDGLGTHEIARPGYEMAFPQITITERWQHCLEAFRIVVKEAEEQSVILALQNHPPIVRNHTDCLAMVEEVGSPNLKISFNISGEGAWQQTDWILEAGRCLSDRWVYSHFGGGFKREQDGTVVRIPLGRISGPMQTMDWNYDAWVQAMSEVGYSGYVSYEACPNYLSNGRYEPMEVIDRRVQMAKDYIEQIFTKYYPKGDR
ncbi:MAG: TIM barrel protein [Clostridia bacterium]|nr:TIM barrel protein [Clostridia bacterium]